MLASDYYYPSLLHATERLVGRGVRSLSEAWCLISRNPAAAMWLVDRGTIEPGTRFLADRSVPVSGLFLPKFPPEGDYAFAGVQRIDVGRLLAGAQLVSTQGSKRLL